MMNGQNNPDGNTRPGSSVPTTARVARKEPSKPAQPGSSLTAAPTLLSLLKALRKRLVPALLAGLAVAAVFSAAAWLLIAPARHSVSAKVYLKEPQKIIFPHEKEADFSMYQRTQVALIKSRHVLMTALDQPEVKDLSIIREAVEAVTEIEKAIQVDFKDSPQILRITMEGDKAEELKIIVDAVTTAYLYHFDKEAERAREERLAVLQKVKKIYSTKLTAKRDELLAMADGLGVTDPGEIGLKQHVANMVSTLAQSELLQLRGQKIKLESQLALEYRKHFKDIAVPLYGLPTGTMPTPLAMATVLEKEYLPDTAPLLAPPAPTKPLVQKDVLLADYFKRKSELEYLLKQGLSDGLNPDKAKEMMKPYQSELAALLQLIDTRQKELSHKFAEPQPTSFGSPLDYLKSQLLALEQHERGLNLEIKKHKESCDNLARVKLQVEEVRKDYDQLDKNLTSVKSLIDGLEVEKDAPSRVVPLQKATVYPPPVIGRREMITGAGGLGGLVLILLGFAWLEFQSRRVDSKEDITQLVGLNFIGSVPDISRRWRVGFLTHRSASALARDRMLMDSVDGVRTALMSTAKEELVQVVMVTSATVGEGKTSTAGHLAASLARAGQRTLLIDCDLRNPNMHKIFGAELSPGLGEALRQECPLSKVIQPSLTEGLSLVAAGRCPGQTIHCFSEKRMTAVLQQLRPQFDFIVVDSSPISMVPEAQVLSRCVDGVIMSVMRNVSKLPRVYAACDLLGRLRTRKLGFILSGVREETHANSAYYALPAEPAAPIKKNPVSV